jgi:hypothetical protein
MRVWLGYFLVFVLVTVFVAGLLHGADWITKLLGLPVNPIYLAAGGICGFLACLKAED